MGDQTMSAVPAKGADGEAAMNHWGELLVARARSECVASAWSSPVRMAC